MINAVGLRVALYVGVGAIMFAAPADMYAQRTTTNPGVRSAIAHTPGDSGAKRVDGCADLARKALKVDFSVVKHDSNEYREYARLRKVAHERAGVVARKCLGTVSIDIVPGEKLLQLSGLQLLAGDMAAAAASIIRFATTPAVSLEQKNRLLNGVMIQGPPGYDLAEYHHRALLPALRALIAVADSASPANTRISLRVLLANTTRAVDSMQAYHIAGNILTVIETFTPEERRNVPALVSLMIDSMMAWAIRDGEPARAIGFAVRAGALYPDSAGTITSASKFFDIAALFGTVAPPLEAPRWINAAAGTTRMAFGHGKVTLIEFTNWACGVCRLTYQPMITMQRELASRGFQTVIATALLGSFQGSDPLTPEAEAVADSGYFVGHYGIRFPIAIANDLIKDVNAKRYRIFGAPQFVLIDRRGIIRDFWYGWDSQSELHISASVHRLLDES